MTMDGIVIGPIKLQLGNQILNEEIHVAPIADEMLFGVDLLRKHNANISIPNAILTLNGENLPIIQREDSGSTAEVCVDKGVCVPPCSVSRVKCSVALNSSPFLVEPLPFLPIPVLIPRSLHESKKDTEVFLINSSDMTYKLRRGDMIGKAFQVSVIEPEIEPSEDVTVRSINTVKASDSDIPPHLLDLWGRSNEGLAPEEQEELRGLLLKYQSVFAKDEFDLGGFNEVTHSIDTGDARPIKQKMRRTPLNFIQEEQAHLDKMLAAGVIQPSMSEWASPPVLVRKKRWRSPMVH
nr:uncharacterized protein LOC129271337 [Lytechinus pictus]